jgi:hypothetical protein
MILFKIVLCDRVLVPRPKQCSHVKPHIGAQPERELDLHNMFPVFTLFRIVNNTPK